MNKFLFLLLIVALISSFGPCIAQEPESELDMDINTYEDWDYIENETGWTLIAYHGTEKNIAIPSLINEKPVTELDKNLLASFMNFEEVYIPEGIIVRGNGILPEEEEPEITEPDEDSEPEIFTFENWSYQENQTGLTLIDYLGDEREIVIPDRINDKPVTELGKELFINCMYLEKVYIPDSVAVIGASAFFGCASLKEIRISPYVKKIESSVFRYCISLEQVELPFALTVIGAYAFSDCIRLKSIVIPPKVTSVGESAFDNCQMLSSLNLSRKVTGLGGNAFRDTAWLNNQTDEFVFVGRGILIKWNGTGSSVNVPYGTTMIVDAFAGKYDLENVVIPPSVKRIGQYAFKNAVNLKHIDIPAFTTRIDGNAFEGCRSLTEIELPNTITILGASAFQYCESLTKFEIPRKVTSIPARLLGDCHNLTEVSIPETVTKINAQSFAGSLKVHLNVVFDSEGQRFAEENGIPYSTFYQKTDDFVYSRKEDGMEIAKYIGNLYDVEVPAEIDGVAVTRIGTGAFQNNINVRRVILPMTIKSIGDWAFAYMDSLEYIKIPFSLNQLGANVFTGDGSLKEIMIPKGVFEIGIDPIDRGRDTVICVTSDTESERLMQEMGYEIYPENFCTVDEEKLANWAELNNSGILGVTNNIQQPLKDFVGFDIIRIPDDITYLTADMLSNTGNKVVLIIPSGIEAIDASILRGKYVVIIGESGSSAEVFARTYNLVFLVNTGVPLY